MKTLLRVMAIGFLAFALSNLWACSSSSTAGAGTAGTTASGGTAPTAGTSTAAGTAAPAEPTRSGETGAMSAPAGAASSVASAAGGSLTDTLGTSLGLTGDQAAGGVGSVLSLAQEKLPATDYTKVASAVPGADTYVQKAKDLGAVPSSGVGDTNGLNAAYAKLGISPEIGSKLTSAVVDYVGKSGGSSVGGLLAGVLK